MTDDDFLSHISDTLDSWFLGTTQGGYMGLVPKSALKNDVVAVADSCPFPLLLRSSQSCKEADAQFVLVGGCHIHGIAEALGRR
jgi:hypothetical protein